MKLYLVILPRIFIFPLHVYSLNIYYVRDYRSWETLITNHCIHIFLIHFMQKMLSRDILDPSH